MFGTYWLNRPGSLHRFHVEFYQLQTYEHRELEYIRLNRLAEGQTKQIHKPFSTMWEIFEITAIDFNFWVYFLTVKKMYA